jgi:hypothetical protein
MKKTWLTTICFLLLIFGFFISNLFLLISLTQESKAAINLNNAKEIMNAFDSKFRERISGREKIINIYGIFNLIVNKKMIGNFEYIKDKKNNMQLVQNYRPHYENIRNSISSLSEITRRKNTPLLYFYFPGTADEKVLPVVKDIYIFNQYDENIAEIVSGLPGVELIDTNNIFDADDKIKFKTDLHLKTHAEFRLAQAIADTLHEKGVIFDGIDDIFNVMNYNIISYDFIGNLRAAGRYFTRGIDKFELYIPTYNSNLLLYNPSGNILKKGSYEQTVMNGYEHSSDISEYTYWVTNYMQYPSPYYTIDNLASNNKTRLLFIMDSLSMRAITFLAPGVEHITVVDPRTPYSERYLQLSLENNEYDAVIIAGSTAFLEAGKMLNLYEMDQINQSYGNSGMWIDYCNNIAFHDVVELPLNGNDDLKISGWAFDVNSLKPLSELYVSIGDKIVKCVYGNAHPGVSSTFNAPDLTHTAFEVTIPREILEDQSEINFIMVGTDGSYRYKPITYRVNLPKNNAEIYSAKFLRENNSLIAEVKVKNTGNYTWENSGDYVYIATWGGGGVFDADDNSGSWVGDGGIESGIRITPGTEYTFRIELQGEASMVYRFIMVQVKDGQQSFIGDWSSDYRLE